jgi:RNA polymerase sigma-70 factor (ECF subfamily)
MSDHRESETRERMARHWLAAEQPVRAYIAGAVRSFSDREDLLQQVALTVARRFDEYDEQRPFLAWALWIAKSRIIDHYRAGGRRPQLLSDTLLERYAESMVRHQETFSRRREALEDCLERLPERSRSMLQRRYHEGLNIEQIAAAVRSTPASVRVTLFRIREALAACIDRKLASDVSKWGPK